MKTSFLYRSIFMYGSMQSVGHTVDYFVPRTRKLIVFYVMPRINSIPNMVRVYRDGKLHKEQCVPSSTNIVLYYLLWWYHHTMFLFRYFSSTERLVILAGHPVALFGMRIVKLFRQATYAYWIGDYFPPVHWSLIAFEKLKKYYHDRVPLTYYLSDRINRVMNSRVLHTPARRTIMWGVKPPPTRKKAHITNPFRMLFVGVVRPSQGIEDVLGCLRTLPGVHLSILGSCEPKLFSKYQHIIRAYGLEKRIQFPNRFIPNDELVQEAKKCHVGIALYETGTHTATHYTDPGKVKTYIEFGLPVIMTDTSLIAGYIKKYSAGEVVNDPVSIPDALGRIRRDYAKYQAGVAAFARHFTYDRYYQMSFVEFEGV